MLANPAYHKVKRPRRSHGPLVLLSAVLLLTLVVGLVCAWLMLQTVASYYASRIYPNVYVLGMNLGRLTPEEATVLLGDAARRADTGVLILRAGSTGPNTGGENHWPVPWSAAGLYLDVPATIQAAFAIGHTAGTQGLWEQARAWLHRHDVAPIFAVDPAQARGVLERLAPSLFIPPTDATLRLEGERVVVLPGQPGRELDVEASLVQLLTTWEQGNPVDLLFHSVPPRVSDVTAAQTQAEAMLKRQVVLSAYDVLTDETFSWTLGRSDVVTWLRIEQTADGPTVQVDPAAVQTTLADLAAGLGQGRGWRLEEATAQVVSAFDSGGGSVSLYLTHPPRTYVVQPGDTISSIAAASGMPTWLILRANPTIDPNWLHVGQELTIPSQDLLTPYLPVPGKRITVSIAEQRMRAYENGALIYDWPVSTGIADSPTSTGVFQILGKEENAYASLWDLWMPHFMAIYPAGPDFYNGFHGLPTLSNGRRLWEGLLGSPASYGCIILGLEEAETFYGWAEVGVVVVIK